MPPVHRERRIPAAASVATWLASATVGWGALAFGGNYPWAYWPLAIAALSCGVAALAANRQDRVVHDGALLFGLGALALAVLLQLTPLPAGALRAISPNTPELLSGIRYDFAGPAATHPVSLVPVATATAGALYVAFAVMFVGTTRLFSVEGPRRFVEGVTILAVVLALAGIVQKPLYNGKIFGFWQPEFTGSPFGPFVNKNHFAGWMLLALPLTLSLTCAGVEHAMRSLKPGWRARVLWLSSPEANRLVLLAGAAFVMALSLVLTMSRSGMSALALALVLTGWFVTRGDGSRSRKAASGAYLAVVTVTLVMWVGADVITARFSNANWSEFNNRRGAWADAWNVASAFPLAGTGLNTYGTVSRFYQTHDLNSYYGESHNDYLQLAAEGGLLLGVPLLFCLAAFVREVRRRFSEQPGSTSWWLRRGAVTALVAIALQETVDFSLQMPGNAVLFAAVCAVAIHRAPSRQPQPARVCAAPVPFIENSRRPAH